MAEQRLTHYYASCFDGARNAQAWAHNHANQKQHRVELQLGWNVRPKEIAEIDIGAGDVRR